FYTCSVLKYLKINEYDFEEEAIIINSINGNGKCNIHLGKQYCLTSNNIHFKSKNENVLNIYIYYYLKSHIYLLENKFKGTNQKKITIEDLKDIEIPFPELSKQKKICNEVHSYFQLVDTSKEQ